ncbi:hypothetical protein BDV23DRAFT_48833 [Aspergillus alliaceus]|uniref:Uncharacterized protein n=1 Tax=Petromyces alliaceus TaxID=209559 RepID=A0A5N7CFS2_PETAA|nr:hypothetical protein BDV23DRAFT_48833 [Aspergillus alliaceus]
MSRFLSLVRLPSRWRPRDSLSSNLFRRQLRQMEASFKASTVLLLPFGTYLRAPTHPGSTGTMPKIWSPMEPLPVASTEYLLWPTPLASICSHPKSFANRFW